MNRVSVQVALNQSQVSRCLSLAWPEGEDFNYRLQSLDVTLLQRSDFCLFNHSRVFGFHFPEALTDCDGSV